MIGSELSMTKMSAVRAIVAMRVTTIMITTAMRGEHG
jgi:hypothetical protein